MVRDLFRALREIPESELVPVVEWLQKSHGYDAVKARAVTLSDFREADIIRNHSWPTSNFRIGRR